MSNINTSRRQFLKSGGALSAAGVASPWLLNLAAMADASAATVPGDYKALVCVFLEGGNDACNTILPKLNDSVSWARYATVRSEVGVRKPGTNTLITSADYTTLGLPTIQSTAGTYPLHPKLTNLASLYASNKLAVVANVGNILGTTTNATPATGQPPLLRSHNDQQTMWRSGRSHNESRGWGGRYAERFDFPAPPTGLNYANYFRSVAIGDNNVFSMGDSIGAYGLTSAGAGVVALLPQTSDNKLFGASSQDLLRKVIRGEFKTTRTNLIEQDHVTVMKRSLDTQQYMSNLIGTDTTASVTMPNFGLAKDLRMVARVIRGNSQTAGRQVFFVMLRGFDNHSGLLASHPALLDELDQSLAYFQQALGPAASKVVTFTASDFGRLLHQNGGGADHGWGGHQFVISEAMTSTGGGKLFGRIPSYQFNSPNYTDAQVMRDGALVPEISIEGYGASLGKWFGVPDADLTTVFAKPLTGVHAPLAGLLPGV